MYRKMQAALNEPSTSAQAQPWYPWIQIAIDLLSSVPVINDWDRKIYSVYPIDKIMRFVQHLLQPAENGEVPVKDNAVEMIFSVLEYSNAAAAKDILNVLITLARESLEKADKYLDSKVAPNDGTSVTVNEEPTDASDVSENCPADKATIEENMQELANLKTRLHYKASKYLLEMAIGSLQDLRKSLEFGIMTVSRLNAELSEHVGQLTRALWPQAEKAIYSVTALIKDILALFSPLPMI